jgi:hypothetical protein
VAGDGMAVVEMRMFVGVEMRVPTGVQPNLEISLRVDTGDHGWTDTKDFMLHYWVDRERRQN